MRYRDWIFLKIEYVMYQAVISCCFCVKIPSK